MASFQSRYLCQVSRVDPYLTPPITPLSFFFLFLSLVRFDYVGSRFTIYVLNCRIGA